VVANRQSSGRTERPLKRRGPQFAQRRTFTIVCEGQTAVAYFKNLVRLVRIWHGRRYIDGGTDHRETLADCHDGSQFKGPRHRSALP
jgi:hypothetical protein